MVKALVFRQLLTGGRKCAEGSTPLRAASYAAPSSFVTPSLRVGYRPSDPPTSASAPPRRRRVG
eukprot:5993392-Alexandrium_andersonii.AAC.1